jgi:hypothetical protein
MKRINGNNPEGRRETHFRGVRFFKNNEIYRSFSEEWHSACQNREPEHRIYVQPGHCKGEHRTTCLATLVEIFGTPHHDGYGSIKVGKIR